MMADGSQLAAGGYRVLSSDYVSFLARVLFVSLVGIVLARYIGSVLDYMDEPVVILVKAGVIVYGHQPWITLVVDLIENAGIGLGLALWTSNFAGQEADKSTIVRAIAVLVLIGVGVPYLFDPLADGWIQFGLTLAAQAVLFSVGGVWFCSAAAGRTISLAEAFQRIRPVAGVYAVALLFAMTPGLIAAFLVWAATPAQPGLWQDISYEALRVITLGSVTGTAWVAMSELSTEPMQQSTITVQTKAA